MRRLYAIVPLLLGSLGASVRAQDVNINYPISVIEQRLARDTFKIIDLRGSRRPNDRTQRVTVSFADSAVMISKWAVAAPNGETFNNSPRYEVAAYEIQKLFLDEPDYVVPPTLMRVFDLDWYRTISPDVRPTFGNKTSSVLVV
ncbi:MAG TPA: hypothetical protein VK864_18270, partial [Longimicrobiales bacterium]|nr:hypothetical protein [Longimicrobiales bacterium]